MNSLALLVIVAAALVWLGQWISAHAVESIGAHPLTPRLRARLAWWGSHRAGVRAACVAVAAGGLVSGVLVG